MLIVYPYKRNPHPSRSTRSFASPAHPSMGRSRASAFVVPSTRLETKRVNDRSFHRLHRRNAHTASAFTSLASRPSVRPSVLQVGGVRVHASEKTKRNRLYAIDGARKERFASSIHRDAPRITRRAGRRTQSGGGACAPAGRPVGRSVVSRHTYLVRRCTNRLRRRRGRHHRGRRYRSSLSVVAIGRRRRYPKNEAPNETNPCLDGGGRGRWWWSTTREGEVNKRRDSRLFETRDSLRLETL